MIDTQPELNKIISVLESLTPIYRNKKEATEDANKKLDKPLSYSEWKNLWQRNNTVGIALDYLLIKNVPQEMPKIKSSWGSFQFWDNPIDNEYNNAIAEEDINEYDEPVISGVTAHEQMPDPTETYQKMRMYFDKIDHLQARKINQLISFKGGPICLVNIADIHFGGAVDIKRVFDDIEIINNTPRMYINFLGDLGNNFIGSWTRKINHNSPFTIEEEQAISKYYIQQISSRLISFTSGNHDCLSSDTECLTKRGWLNYTDLTLDDQILSINLETNKSEWTNINKIVEYDFDGELNHGITDNTDMLITDNHRILHQRRSGKNFLPLEFKEQQQLNSNRIRIPIARESNFEGYEIDDNELFIISWLLTDGGFKDTRLVIYQRASNSKQIENALNELDIEYSFTERDRREVLVNIDGVDTHSTELEHIFTISQRDSKYLVDKFNLTKDKKFPDWVWKLDQRQFSILFNVFIDADGTWPRQSTTCCVFYGQKQICDELQILCILHGYRASIYTYYSNNGNPQYRVNICLSREDNQIELKNFWSKQKYNGKIWCLKVPHTNFMVRRNGKAFFTGNCWTAHESGIDIMKTYLNELDSPAVYDTYENVFTLDIDGMQSVVRTRHQWLGSSQYNDTHAIEKAAKFDQAVPFDIGVGGHTHRSGLYREFNNGGKTGVAILCGTYKRTDEYAREVGFPQSNKSTAVCVIIDPDSESGYHGVSDINSAAKYMRLITK